jgi:hypothetical protein
LHGLVVWKKRGRRCNDNEDRDHISEQRTGVHLNALGSVVAGGDPFVRYREALYDLGTLDVTEFVGDVSDVDRMQQGQTLMREPKSYIRYTGLERFHIRPLDSADTPPSAISPLALSASSRATMSFIRATRSPRCVQTGRLST